MNTMSSIDTDYHEEEGVVELPAEEPLLSESLVGLFGAFDKLKETMGFSEGDADENFTKIQEYVENIRRENDMIRQHAEDAITMAQRYKEAFDDLAQENAGLYDKLTEASVNDMVMHTQELSSVAYEYDKEVVMTKMAQAEEMVAHAYEMQQRLEELEEENDALKQTLHELREDQKQFHILKKMDGAFDQNSPHLPLPDCESPVLGSPIKSHLENGMDDSQTPVVAAQSPSQEITPGTKTHGTPDSSRYVTPISTMKKDDPIAIADALASVAGGSESGMAASASKMLRGYHMLQEEVEELREKNEALMKENQELTETMTSKQFKPPSAWAEREVKYKLERKEWEESMHAKVNKITELEKENKSLRSNNGTDELNQKIIDLEAQLVVMQRDNQTAKAALHDMQVSSLMSAGEFSLSGVRPFSKQDDVHSMIDKIESESESHEVSSHTNASAANQVKLEQELEELQKEKHIIMNQITNIQNEQTSSERVKCEIALLENGVGVDVALKIISLEEKLAEKADVTVKDASLQEEISSVSSMLKNAFKSAETRGDNNASETMSAMHVMQYVKPDEPAAAEAEANIPDILSQEALDRIKELQMTIQEPQDIDQQNIKQASQVSTRPNETNPHGMKPQAAAALAAVNRAQEKDIKHLKSQLEEYSMREAALKEEIERVHRAGQSSKLKQDEVVHDSEDTLENLRKRDFAAVLREKAEIEAKYDMAKMQLTKSQEALEMSRQEQAAMKKAIKAAIATGELANVQTALNDNKFASKSKITSPLKKMRAKGIFSMRKGSGSRPGSGSSEDQNLRLKVQPSSTEMREKDDEEHDASDFKYQLSCLQEENDMLMDQLVTTKVRLAEVEGDCLQSKRALVRAKEKQMDLARQLHSERASK